MKTFLAYVFIVLYLVALLRPVAPLIEFYARQKYFAEVLCVNKDKPEMQCHGNCVLMKKLKEVNEPASAPTLPKIDLKEYPVGFVSGFTLTLRGNSIASSINEFYKPSHHQDYFPELLKPPQL